MSRKVNPLIGQPRDRRQELLERLTAPAIQNNTPEYHQTAPVQVTKQLVTVTLDKLRPYEGNPRKTKNPAYEEIKASIKARGLDHAPNITKRPGEDFYIIADGGNTRLQALNELFKETQDPRFWSIECIFKPWAGEANDINSKLNILIGHLTENEIRGELSFIEKALGIREVKKLYEAKFEEKFSHRKLSEQLSENGYPISNQLIARMEQCLTYLYPHIPNVLLEGLGRPHIEKLLQIQRNAEAAWDKYKLDIEPNADFDEVWMHTLSPFDEAPTEFAIETFQDSLIGKLSEAFHYAITYDTFKIDIDLEERKLKRILEKQPEIKRLVEESLQREQARASTTPPSRPSSNDVTRVTPTPTQVDPIATSFDDDDEQVHEDNIDAIHTVLDEVAMPSFNEPPKPSSPKDHQEENELAQAITAHYQGLGMIPGVNPEAQRAEEAEANGLAFANTGKHPITNLWKIHPKRQHKMDAFTLALDIANTVGLAHLVQHVVKQPVDYSFQLLPFDSAEPTPLTTYVYQFLCACATAEIETNTVSCDLVLPSSLLLGTHQVAPEIDDLLLVRMIRLLRIIRYIKAQIRGE